MKQEFFDIMYQLMQDNPDVYLIFVGLGYPRVDEFLAKFPNRAINTEASEQTALDIAVGLAYAGKIPFVYTITPFLLRGFETIRTYINHEKLNVKLVGVGRNDDYSQDDGVSHFAGDIYELLLPLKNIDQIYPDSIEQLKPIIMTMAKDTNPCFLNIRQ